VPEQNAGNREILDGPRRVDAEIGISGNLHFSDRIAFEAGSFHRCVSFVWSAS
jgi:hypothetical protein